MMRTNWTGSFYRSLDLAFAKRLRALTLLFFWDTDGKRNYSSTSEASILDRSAQEDRLLEKIARVIECRRLDIHDLRRVDFTITGNILAGLRLRDRSVCSLSRLELIANGLSISTDSFNPCACDAERCLGEAA